MLNVKALSLPFCLGRFVLHARPSGIMPTPAQTTQSSSVTKSGSSKQEGKRKVEFYPISAGEMLDKDGIHFGFSNFKAADGTYLMVIYGDFESYAKAKNYFEKQLAEAANVIERKDKLNAVGKAVGERAEILKRFDDQKTMPALLWTDGVSFHEIYSSSRENVLKLEKIWKY